VSPALRRFDPTAHESAAVQGLFPRQAFTDRLDDAIQKAVQSLLHFPHPGELIRCQERADFAV
jgi:hypothetical protein